MEHGKKLSAAFKDFWDLLGWYCLIYGLSMVLCFFFKNYKYSLYIFLLKNHDILVK